MTEPQVSKKPRRLLWILVGAFLLLCACPLLASPFLPEQEEDATEPAPVSPVSSPSPHPTVTSTEPTQAPTLPSASTTSTLRPPTQPSSATDAIVASVTPERRGDLIVFTPDIIDSPIQEAERILGTPFEIYDLGIGEVEEVPDGGQERAYQAGRYTIYVTFDKDGIAHGLQVADGLLEDGYRLDDWPTVLARIGVGFVGLPDIVAPAARRWTDAYGYAIMVAAESINGTVWTVRIYEIPD